jgi:hypothetical protein
MQINNDEGIIEITIVIFFSLFAKKKKKKKKGGFFFKFMDFLSLDRYKSDFFFFIIVIS